VKIKSIFLRLLILMTYFLPATTASGQTDVLTQHNDVSRTGWNHAETQLNISNVSPSSFGLIASRMVDDQIYAQPLIVNGVSIGGVPKNVVYVATVNNTLYAFDADSSSVPAYWSVNLTHPSRRPPNSSDIHSICGAYNDFNEGSSGSGVFGIVGTPVIDKSSNTIYVVSRDVDPGAIDQTGGYPATGFYQYLHAIDISTGLEKNGSPVSISAVAAGLANGNNSGVITFDTRRQNQRGGLLLMNGVLYIAYAGHCDWDNYNGWVLAYDVSTMTQKVAYIASPNDGGGGVWMSGGGIAADPAANNGNGSIYFSSGNSGRTDPNASNPNTSPSILENRGEGIIKLNPDAKGSSLTKLTIADYFTPSNYGVLNSSDLDFGTQVMLVPGSNILVAGCKDYNLYTFDKTNLGGYDSNANHNLQKIFVSTGAGMHTAFAYFGGSNHQYFYQFAENTNLKAFQVSANSLSTTPINGIGNGPQGQGGSMMATSSNGSNEATGILWISHSVQCDANQNRCPGILRAVNAANPTSEIWNSNINPNDAVGYFSKNACPTVANGKVYLATFSNKLNIYGLLATDPQCATNIALNKTATDNTGNVNGAELAIDGDIGTGWTSSGMASDYLQINLGGPFNICRINITWANANSAGKDFLIQTADNSSGPWTTIQTVNGNTSLSNQFDVTTTGNFVRMQGVTQVNNYDILEMAVFGQPIASCLPPTGLVANNVTQNSADISWNAATGAQSYLLRYKTSLVSSYITRTISAGTAQSINALTCGLDYTVDLQSVCSSTDSSSFVSIPISTAACTNPCTLLTRYNHDDIGDIGIAGTSCSVNVQGPPQKTEFTVQGSGNDIGGTSDEFQFADIDIAGDATYTGVLTNQDNTGSNKAGVMMRDSLSNTSRFAFIGFTQGAGVEFIYRGVPNGPSTVIRSPFSITLPYYFQIVKTGTVFTANMSPDGSDGSWVTVGSADLGFGVVSSVKQGFAVTSADNTQLSTAVFDLMDSSPLPVTLISFTATNINNDYVSLKWTTSLEENNNYFRIEHSTDGITFKTLDTVKSQGNSVSNQTYSLPDNHPANGINYYRIKQYDLDGRVTVYPVVTVKFGVDGEPLAYPNPAISAIHIISGDQLIQNAILYDLMGKEVKRIDNSLNEESLLMKIDGLSPGVYLLKIITPDKTYQQKVIKE
jgi:hypothetical protein